MSADRTAGGAEPAAFPSQGTCRSCAHFRNDPAWLERTLPGLASLSSAYAAVRDEDGLCLAHGRFTGARQVCPTYAPAYPTPRQR